MLLADDSATSREVIARMLRHIGCEVVTASDGASAVAKARQRPFAAILMDCQMPVVDGYAATQQIRAEEQRTPVPIYAMTASAMPDILQAIEDAGMDGALPKPPSLDQLCAVVGMTGTAAAP